MRLFGRSPWVLVAGAAFAVLKYFLDKVCLMVCEWCLMVRCL